MTYIEADEKLTRNGKRIDRRKVANNTYLERRGEAIAMRLHDTDVVTFKANGDTVLNTGGWYTVTTKDRINLALGGSSRVRTDDGYPGPVTHYGVHSVNKVWKLSAFNEVSGWQLVADFADGMVVNKLTKTVSGAYDSTADTKYNAELDKKIRRYLDGLTPEIIKGFDLNSLGGDCWYCVMTTVEDGKSLGDSFKDHEHLLSHLDERYYMASLLLRAAEHAHYSNPGWILIDWINRPEAWRGTIRRQLGKYLRDRLFKGPRDGRRGDL